MEGVSRVSSSWMCLRQIDVNVVLFADRSIVSAKESIDR